MESISNNEKKDSEKIQKLHEDVSQLMELMQKSLSNIKNINPNENEVFLIKETGKSYAEFAQWALESRRIFIDGLNEMMNKGVFLEEDYKKILNTDFKNYITHFPLQ